MPIILVTEVYSDGDESRFLVDTESLKPYVNGATTYLNAINDALNTVGEAETSVIFDYLMIDEVEDFPCKVSAGIILYVNDSSEDEDESDAWDDPYEDDEL